MNDYQTKKTAKKGTTLPAEEQYCPICGSNAGATYSAHSAHRCKDSVIRAINAANTRAENGNTPEFPRSFAQRLSEGYELLGLEDRTQEE